MARLQDRAAIVTGGSGGIGSAAVERFVAEGANVIIADIDEAAAVETAGRFAGATTKVIGVGCDVAEPDQVTAAVERCVAEFGRVDVYFSNAATSTGGYTADLDLAGWDHSLKVMLSATLYGLQAVVPHMIAQGGGSIIATSSVYGLAGGAANGPYCAAKAGLIGLCRTAAVEYGRRNIRVNAICPGVVDTPMFESVLGIGLTTREAIAAQTALGRIIEPGEIADLALFLASDESSAITGQAIVIDAGLLAGIDLTGVPPAG